MFEKETNKTIARGSSGLAIKAGFWYVLSTFLLKGSAFITIPFFSRLMSKGDYGEFANYANWQSVLLCFTGAELYSSLSRAYYDYKDDYDEFASSVTFLSLAITTFFYVLFLVCRPWIYDIVRIPPQYTHIMFFTLAFSACKSIYLTRERTLYRYKSVVFISVLDTLIPTALAVLLVALSEESDRLGMRIYGFYFPSSIIGLVCACVLVFSGKTIKREHCKYALTLSIPLLFNYLTINLLSSTNTIIAKNFGSAELSADVSMATSVIHILTIGFQAVTGALTTWLMDNLHQGNLSKIRKESLCYLAGFAVVSIGVILLSPEILMILGGARYAASISLIPGFVFAAFMQAITTIFTIILTYNKKVVFTAAFTGVVAIISIGAKLMLFPIYGIDCLPLVNIAVCLMLFAMGYLLVCRTEHREAISIVAYIGIILSVLIFTLLGHYLYLYTIIRYVITASGIIGVLLFLFLSRKRICALLKG